MTSSFLITLQQQPLTLAHILFMTFLFLWQWNYDIPASWIGVHYDRVLEQREWWRLITSAYSHLGVLHIGFNMYSLWSYGFLEYMLGSLTYCRYSFILLLASQLLMLLGTWVLFRFFGSERQRNTYTLGYSGSDTRIRGRSESGASCSQ